MTITPYGYQKDGVRAIERWDGRAIIGDDMGLGKTPQALWWLLRYHRTRRPLPALAIVPASVKDQWQMMAADFVNLRAEVLEGREPPKDPFGFFKAKLYIINYDILATKKKKGEDVDDDECPFGGWLPVLDAFGFRTIILDECQNIKSRDSMRTQAVQWLCRDQKKIPYVICLSGTPIENRPSEFWPALNLVQPELFPSFTTYGHEYCKPEKKPWGKWTYNGAENLDELHEIITESCFIRRRKEEVLKDLPKKTRTIIPVSLSKKDQKEYNKAEDDFITWLEEKWPKSGKAQRAIRAQRMVQTGYLKRLAAQLRIKSTLEWVEEFLETGEKFVLFGIHRTVIEPILEKFKSKTVVVTGSTPSKKRSKAIEQFQADNGTQLFLANIQAGGVGINGLQLVCSNMGFAEIDYVPAKHEQAEARLERIGQQLPVSCYYWVARDTVEEDLCKKTQAKQDVVNAVLDGGQGRTFDIYDLLAEDIKARKRKRK